MKSGKKDRLDKANLMLRAIGTNGRRFFYNKRHNIFSRFECDARGKIWFVDDYTEDRIYTHYSGRWRGFTQGGTMRALVEYLRDYINAGHLLPARVFGPWAQWVCDGDLWGYGHEAMQAIRANAAELGILRASTGEQL